MDPLSSTANPFSAAAVSGGRLSYLFADPAAETKLMQTLERHQWIGQIVGPHGSGKTTLTHHLWTQTQDKFSSLVHVTIRGRGNVQRQIIGEGGTRLFVVDGLERLSRVDRWLFLGGFSLGFPGHRRRAGQGVGLIVTGHRPLPWLPKVFETSFDEVLLNRLVKQLLESSSRTDIRDSDGDVLLGQQWTAISRALLQRHGSNAREILMEMYDLYEANSSSNSSKKVLSKNPFLLSTDDVQN